MADDQGEKELDLEEQEEGEEAEGEAKKGGKLKLIILAVVGVLLIGGIVAGTVFFLNKDDASEDGEEIAMVEEAVEEVRGPAIYLALKPAFIINFPSKGRQRFLQASLTVMARDPEAIEAVTAHMPIVRNNIISLFSAKSFSTLQTIEGIEELRQQAGEEIKSILTEEIGKPGIEQVLFTAFVMQ